jgi:ABC-type nitrate/sulfonate/bicarbonate transport system substrate-binding protein
MTITTAAALVMTGCGDDDPPAEAGTTTVKVGAIGPFTMGTWPLLIADANGYFADEAIEVELTFTFDGGQLLAGGQLDVLGDGADAGLIALQSGKDAIAFAANENHMTDGVIVREEIATVADLEGTTLRTSGAGSTDEFVLARYIEEAGLDPTKVDFQPVEDDGAALVQLGAATIDGGIFDQGLLLEVEQGKHEGVKVLVEPAELGVYPWNMLQTTRSYAEDNPEVITGFIRAWHKAIEFIQDPANKDAVIDVVVGYDETLPREAALGTYDAAKGFGIYVTDPLTPDDIQPALDYLAKTTDTEVTVTAEEFIDNTYYDKAKG